MKHRLILVLAAAYATMALPACIGDEFTVGIPNDDAGPDGGPTCNPCPDTGSGDTGTSGSDSSSSDSGSGGGDSGTPDAGGGDGGDAGCGPCDAGADSSLDSGSDSGMDSGVDSGSDSGSDSGMDSGVDSGSDSGSDAGDGGGPCTNGTERCNGNDPQVCAGSVWVANGGTCNYGCVTPDAGVATCTCTAPGGQLKKDLSFVIGLSIKDTSNVLTWTTFTFNASLHDATYTDAPSICAGTYMDAGVGSIGSVPSVAQWETILAEQTKDNFCSPTDVDPVFTTTDVAWTSDSCGGGMHKIISMLDGTITCESDGKIHGVWCVK